MKKTIELCPDLNCWTLNKIQNDCMGGAEMFFMKLRKWLLDTKKYDVFDPVLNPASKKVDLAIHSNGFDYGAKAELHLLWSGSWHGAVHEPKVDKVIVLSEFMKKQMKCDRAIVIPAPYDPRLDGYKTSDYVLRRVVTTSNPNRHFPHTVKVASILKERGVDFEWSTCGANALYSDRFGECFNFHSSPHIQYRGVLSRNDLFGLLTTAHVWAYANHESSETFCVSVIEAMALGIPVVVYNKEPFVSVVPEAFFVNNEEEMADKIADILGNGPNRVDYDMSRYSEEEVVPQILKEIEEML